MPVPLKQIKNRIRGITNTKKVTGAMQMVSMAKLNRIVKLLYTLRPHFLKMESIFHNLICSQAKIISPYLKEKESNGKIALCIIASDNGLCGLYNNNVIRAAEEFIKKIELDKLKLIVVGKKGFNYFKNKGISILHTYIGLNGRYDDIISDEIANILIHLFLSKEADEVYIAYAHFKSAIVQRAQVEKFLNIPACRGKEIEYILEPGLEKILSELIPKYLKAKLRLMFLEAFTSEHAARSLAMKAATDNAQDLLEALVLQRNKVRQASITQEIMEIVSSAEALRG